MRIITPWAKVLEDGEKFARNGVDYMYWFKPPLGGIGYQEGFDAFLKPALDNWKITKIYFILSKNDPQIKTLWKKYVIPKIEKWIENSHLLSHEIVINDLDGTGTVNIMKGNENKEILWIFRDLSPAYLSVPSFKIFMNDPSSELMPKEQIQFFLTNTAATDVQEIFLNDDNKTPITIYRPNCILKVNKTKKTERLFMELEEKINSFKQYFLYEKDYSEKRGSRQIKSTPTHGDKNSVVHIYGGDVTIGNKKEERSMSNVSVQLGDDTKIQGNFIVATKIQESF